MRSAGNYGAPPRSAVDSGALVCAACGAEALESHLRVAGEAGREGLIPTTARYGSAMSDIVRCSRCGHMQLETFPTEAQLSEAYAEAASLDYASEEVGQRQTARKILEAIERHVGRGALLDLGCWLGFLLSEAEARGWQGVGVEPSEFASNYAREHLGLDVRTAGLFDAGLPEGRFQAVVLADVIEHLPRAGEALDRVAALLAEGGVLAMVLPDAGSRLARVMGARWWSVIPTHVHYFTRHSMQTLVSRHGFRTLSIETAPKTFTVRYYLGRIAGYRPGTARVLTWAAYRAQIAERLWTPDFRDRMLVTARRPGALR